MIRYINDINVRNYYGGAEVSVTGTLTQTQGVSVQVPANTFKAGDLVTIDTLFSKNGTAGNFTYRLFWNSTDTISGAIQLTTRSISNTQLFATCSRRLSVRTANGTGSSPEVGTELISTTAGLFTEYQSNGISNVAIDWTVDGYIMGAITLSSTADTVINQYLKIWTY
jgi:hypothetical protein